VNGASEKEAATGTKKEVFENQKRFWKTEKEEAYVGFRI
jgi:hypothetical protein